MTRDPVLKDPSLIYKKMKPGQLETLERIAAAINERKSGDAAKSYVAKLFRQGDDAMLKKIGEEATEVVLAAKGGERLPWCARSPICGSTA